MRRFPIQTAWVSNTPPSDPPKGLIWLDTSVSPVSVKVWTGSKWQIIGGIDDEIYKNSFPPPSPQLNDLWLDTSHQIPILKVYTQNGWQPISSIYFNVTTINANTTLTSSHSVVLVNANTSPVTVTLPSATGLTGKTVLVKKIDNSANSVTIQAQTGQTIDGVSSVQLLDQHEFMWVISDGTNWFIIAK